MSKKPTFKDLMSDDAFFEYAANGQTYNTKGGAGIRSTASINGGKQYFATSHTVADILQGTLLQRNPEDQLLVINKALTSQLEGLRVDKVHTFGTLSMSSPAMSVSGSGDINGLAFDGTGSIKQEWITSLPLVHPDGPLIWSGDGKASSEMHLPTSDSIETDIAQHDQYSGLPDNRKHPWNMDRVGGGIGGETKIYSDPSTSSSILGESKGAPGQQGAFGLLSPLEEKFYISMAWPYKGNPIQSFEKAGRTDLAKLCETLSKSQYRGKRIMVFSKETRKGVVCTPGDWGTQPYWSNGAVSRNSINGFYYGLSPDVHYALGTQHGAEMIVRFMPDDTPLGPYTPTSEQAGGSGFSGTTSDVSSSFVNTLEEMKYAGELIYNHPNMQAENFTVLKNGFQAQRSSSSQIVPTWFPSINRGFLFPSLLNYLWYILEGGFIIGQQWGSYVHKQALGDNSRLSNHAYGGAVDIGAMGYGESVGYKDPKWRAYNDRLFEYLATLPRNTKPSEVGSSFEADYGWFHVYKDGNPNHIHLGFSPNQVGQLIPALKKGGTGTSGAARGFR